jgi:hypothetical protein
VTGAAGFIGGHLLERLIELGWDVAVVNDGVDDGLWLLTGYILKAHPANATLNGVFPTDPRVIAWFFVTFIGTVAEWALRLRLWARGGRIGHSDSFANANELLNRVSAKLSTEPLALNTTINLHFHYTCKN